MRRMSLTSRAVHSSSMAISSGRRLAAELLDELALDVHDLVQLLDHVHRDADRAGLVGDRARHGLADPPGGVGRELVAAPVVELLDRADQAERPLLDQVEERQPPAQIALGDRDDEAQVRLDHLLLGEHVAALDALGQARPPRRRSAGPRARSSAGTAAASRGSARPSGRSRASSARAAPPPASARTPPARASLETISMPASRRCRCRSRTCSFVTSTSSRQAAISSNVRISALACPPPRARAVPRLSRNGVSISSDKQCHSLVLFAQPLLLQTVAAPPSRALSCDSRFLGVRGACREGLSQWRRCLSVQPRPVYTRFVRSVAWPLRAIVERAYERANRAPRRRRAGPPAGHAREPLQGRSDRRGEGRAHPGERSTSSSSTPSSSASWTSGRSRRARTCRASRRS